MFRQEESRLRWNYVTRIVLIAVSCVESHWIAWRSMWLHVQSELFLAKRKDVSQSDDVFLNAFELLFLLFFSPNAFTFLIKFSIARNQQLVKWISIWFESPSQGYSNCFVDFICSCRTYQFTISTHANEHTHKKLE